MKIERGIAIPDDEIEIHAVRAQGAGGQNVNKVSSAIHLRFDVNHSSLPEAVRERLLASRDRRLSDSGVLVIKAQRYRSQDRNRDDALARLRDFVRRGLVEPKPRKPTRPSRGARERRLEDKKHRARVKARRRDPGD